MPLQPNIPKRKNIIKTCIKCKEVGGEANYSATKSLLYPDGFLPICNNCIKEILKAQEFDWHIVDKICQWADIPFVPAEFERLHKVNGDDVFPIYANVFLASEYENFGWETYFKEFKRLREADMLEDELPEIREEKFRKLRQIFGENYDEEQLIYLDNLSKGPLATQNINGALQEDQAIKLCKISLEIDSRIREGADFDKLLTSYDKLVKVAEFTPKNAKNANDFDSVGEIFAWLEKRGWINKFYDGALRDEVDETMQNIEVFNQRLYTNEPGIGEEIENRIQGLKNAKEMEDNYGIHQEYDLEQYERQASELEEEEFNPEI